VPLHPIFLIVIVFPWMGPTWRWDDAQVYTNEQGGQKVDVQSDSRYSRGRLEPMQA
jgi:hypothetical protein